MSNRALAEIAAFLIEDQPITGNGEGPSIATAGSAGLAAFTLGVIESQEQQSLEVAVYRSADGEAWDDEPILVFPQLFHAGTTELVLDLGKLPGTAYLKARWKASRWGRGNPAPFFRAYLFLRI